MRVKDDWEKSRRWRAGDAKRESGAYEKHCTELQHEVKPCFHCTPIESNTPGKLFNISIVVKRRVAWGKGWRAKFPGLTFSYLAASVVSIEREGNMD